MVVADLGDCREGWVCPLSPVPSPLPPSPAEPLIPAWSFTPGLSTVEPCDQGLSVARMVFSFRVYQSVQSTLPHVIDAVIKSNTEPDSAPSLIKKSMAINQTPSCLPSLFSFPVLSLDTESRMMVTSP